MATTEAKDRRINTDERARSDGAKRLPHERDESPDAEVAPRGIMEQAADDLAQGLVDTDLHGLRGVEQVVTPAGPGQARPRENPPAGLRGHSSTTTSRGRQ